MSRFVSVLVFSFVAVAVHATVVGGAFAQDPPDPATEPPPVAQQKAAPEVAFDRPGFDFGLRLGYALPFGGIDGDDDISEGVSGAVPIVLEAGYRLTPDFTIGALFQYGVMQVKENDTTGCNTPGLGCSGSVIRLGIEGIYNINIDGPFRPWVGIGTGYEWFTFAASGPGGEASLTARGFEFVTLQAGGDYRMSPNFALGPFVSFSLAQYASGTVEVPGGTSVTMDITDKKLHEWLQLGVRGRIGL
jgi:hypothetical protein